MKLQVGSPQRLDAFLTAEEAFHSRTACAKAIRDGAVRVNGEVALRPAHRLEDGDRVEIEPQVILQAETEAEEFETITPADMQLAVLYEDESCLVIDKPPGYAVHPGHATQSELTILHGVAALFAERSLPFSAASVLVHRLDKDTSGALLIAKSPADHSALQKQFKQRTVAKSYLALIAGTPDEAEALIDAPIGRNLTDRTKMSILQTGISRSAQTSYVTLATNGTISLLRCDLHTGRTHQIRVHLRSIGHPIIGDETYGTDASGAISNSLEAPRLCLHAAHIEFDSPASQKRVVVDSPLPADFGSVLHAAGLDYSAGV